MSDEKVTNTRVADALLDALADRGLRHVFVVPGMQIDPLVMALARHATLTPILANHELAAGYMADGYARASGGIGATFAIGGPGCANLVGAAVAAKADRSPVLFVTGNIPKAAQGRGEFQDAGPQGSNDVEVMRAATAMSWSCDTAVDLPAVLAQATSRLSQRNPAHVAVAMDVQTAGADADALSLSFAAPDAVAVSPLPEKNWLSTGRLLMIAGAEALSVVDVMQHAAEKFRLLVATDTAARGIVAEASPHSVGHLGFMPHPRALLALAEAEHVVAIGCDEALLQSLRARHRDVLALSPASFAAWLQDEALLPDADALSRRDGWLQNLADVQRPAARTTSPGEILSYAEVVDCVAAASPDDAAFVIDAGQVRRIAVSRLRCRQPRTLFVAEGMAPMGWSLGAAIGVQLALPDRPVVALLGDGAMRMHGIELATAARYRLPVLYVLFDNGAYGSVLARMDGDAEADTARLPTVDWCAFASAFGVEVFKADDAASLRVALEGADRLVAPRLVVVRVPAVEPDAYGEITGIDWALGSAAQSRLDT